MHNRPLDHAALLLASGALLLARERSAPGALARRLAPAAALCLPLLLLHLPINRAVSGHWLRSGYGLFNDAHDWRTLGFGRGPFGIPHTPSVAAAKTLTVLVRLGFFVAGTPFLPAVLVAWLGGAPRGPRLAAPAVVVAAYVAAYALYAGMSVVTTGPVYYTALVPVLAGWIAALLVAAHDRLRAAPARRRLVPAFAAAQLVAALLVFWPPELLEVARQADASRACEALVERHGLARALVFVAAPSRGPAQSWTRHPPLPGPRFDDPVLFVPLGAPARNARVVARYGRDRPVFVAACLREAQPSLSRLDLATNRSTPVAPPRR